MNSAYVLTAISLIYAAMIVLLVHGTLAARRDSSKVKELPEASIIVAVRDGRETISACMQSLFDQDYPAERLEIIVMDDHSTDGTIELLLNLQKHRRFLLLRNFTVGPYHSSKKSALQTAISEARGELLLFTDADCTPPPGWAKSMAAHFTKNVGLVAGFSPQTAVGLWNGLLLCDSAAAALVAAGTIGWGRGVTCAGRNLAYRRQAFDDVGGFAALPDTLSGDDDFMLQKIAAHTHWQIRYALDPQTVVPARGPASLKAFLRQKRRHISAGRGYSARAKWGYGLFHAANFALWLFALRGVTVKPFFLLPFAAKLLFDGVVLQLFLNRFDLRVARRHILLWQPLFLFYNIYAGVSARIKKPDWK